MFELFAMVHCLSATESELGAWFSAAHPVTLAQRALDRGVKIIVMKRGPAGAMYAGAGDKTGTLSTTPVTGANTVGAGDTFNAGLLHGLSTEMSLQDAVAFAVRIATELVRVGRGAFDLSK